MGTGFYLASIAMLAAGFVVAGWPLLKQRRLGMAALLAVALLAGGGALYPLASNYQPESPAFQALLQARDADTARAAADELAKDLMARPNDFRGWRLLGRARLETGEFAEAEFALRQALRIAPAPDPELMLLLGQSLSLGTQNRIPAEAADLFIGAYHMAPSLPTAMWYGGLAFASRGENKAAITAWEALLQRSPPPEVARLLREQIAVLRVTSEPASADPSAADPLATDPSALTLQVRLGALPPADWPATARLFVSVRDADRPGPPLAAAQYAPGALPLTVELGDSDAMLAGRTISSASNYVIVARVSMSGDPVGGSGDYVGRISIGRDDIEGPLELVIEEVQE